jgi:two-component system cell cycle response regulator
MSGRIMVVEARSTERMMLRAILAADHYDTMTAESMDAAREALPVGDADLMLVSLTGAQAAADLAFFTSQDAQRGSLPIIALADPGDSATRIAALRAGADDVLDHPVDGLLLCARIRSLMRGRDAADALDLPADAERALGLADRASGFVPAGRVAVLTDRAHDMPVVLTQLIDRLPGATRVLDTGQDPAAAGGLAADLYLIDAGGLEGQGLRQLANLRSRPATRASATLVILPSGAMGGALAYDMGADDIAHVGTGVEELAHRVRALLRRKSRADRRREGLQSGLIAAVTDPLTGLYNRRFALPEVERIATRAVQTGRDFALMMIDIDHFKAVNDGHGHEAGDRVLVEVAGRLRRNLRAMDLLARVGGEEFLVVLPDTSQDQAQIAAERLRRVIGDDMIDCADPVVRWPGPVGPPPAAVPRLDLRPEAGRAARSQALQVTISVGLTLGRADLPMPPVDRLIAAADRALYAAKSAGRNTVTLEPVAA